MSLTVFMRGRLPPVGQRIDGAVGTHTDTPLALAGFRSLTLTSGTAALGLALRIARRRRPEIQQPEVLLPGYACPDLLAAADWAGVTPLLVDIGSADHAMDADDLARRCTARTVAVIAVNLLGIADQLDELRAFCTGRELLLIEDDAQWLPEPWAPTTLRGDCVVLSFGRGKPLPLVGGGALLVGEALLSHQDLTDLTADVTADATADVTSPTAALDRATLTTRLAIGAYNFVLARYIYAVLAAVPGLSLGATRYQPLREVGPLDAARRQCLAANLQRQRQRDRHREQWLREMVLPHCPSGTIDLPTRLAPRAGRLLRYPLLLPSAAQRDALYVALDGAGLGASRLYERVLPDVVGVAADIDAPALPNARQFAARLLTLPVHEGVRRADLQRMATIVARFK